jgi:murein DD-endopeptidase MepM/ murein hydrolase activator NlpD
MSREKRRGGPVLLAGLGGFALGAATVLFVVWVYGVPRPAVLPGGGEGPRGRAGAPAPTAPGAPGAPPATGMTPAPAVPSPPATGPLPPPSLAETAADLDNLRRHHLLLPVQGLRRENLSDTFNDARGGHRHEAMDIMAPRNTPVLAVEDGRLVKLFVSRQGGNTIYQFDPSETYTYYYAHLERYAEGVREGSLLRRGQVIGYVGTSGNAPADTPHLHFAIFRLASERHWWQGTAIDPFLVLAQP